MERAYSRYKDYVEDYGKSHSAFLAALSKSKKHATPEEHLERTRLAIVWGEDAIR